MKVLETNTVETAVLAIANGNSVYKSTIAKHIMDEMNTQLYGEDAAPTIYHALYKAALRNNRINALDAKKHNLVDVIFKPAVPDISMSSFLQTVQDKIAWAGRRALQSRITEDENEELMQNANGLDFTADQALEEHGIDATNVLNIHSDMMHINGMLSKVSTQINHMLRIRNADPLYLFAPSTLCPDTNTWVTPVKTNDWDEAVASMNETALMLQMESPITETALTDANNMNFDLPDEDPMFNPLSDLSEQEQAVEDSLAKKEPVIKVKRSRKVA